MFDSQNLAFLFFCHCEANLDSPKQSIYSVIARKCVAFSWQSIFFNFYYGLLRCTRFASCASQ
ncbi:hypothetical protein [Helicobacter sp. 23-1045]